MSIKNPKTINDLNKFDTPVEEDIIMRALKDKYFSLLRAEKWPQTNQTSKELDNLEQAIRGLAKENKEKKSNG
jgi:hypothetical protein